MTTGTGVAKLAEAGLLRQAAATSAGDLLGAIDVVADDVLRAGREAFGTTVGAVHPAGGKLALETQILDVDGIVRNGAGQGVVDSVTGMLGLVDEAAEFATVAGDASMVRAIDRARAELRVAQAYLDTTVKRANNAVRGIGQSTRWEELGTFPELAKFDVTIPDGASTIATRLDRSIASTRRSIDTARTLAAQANERIPAFEAVTGIAGKARADSAAVSGSGDLTMSRVKPLTDGVADLLEVVRNTHDATIPSAFRIEGKHMFVDIPAFDRAIRTSESAVAEARKLLNEADGAIGSAQQHAYVRRQVSTASSALRQLDASLDSWRAVRRQLVDSGHATGQVGSRGLVRFDDGAELELVDGGLRAQLDGLFGKFDQLELRRSIRHEPDEALNGLGAILYETAVGTTNSVGTLVDSHVNGTIPQSLVGLGTQSIIDKTVSSVRGRYGSAEELRAALAAQVA